MWPSWSHLLAPLNEVYIGPKGRSILCNDHLEVEFHEIKRVVSVENLLSYPYCKISFTVHTDISDKSWVLLSVKNINTLLYF